MRIAISRNHLNILINAVDPIDYHTHRFWTTQVRVC